MNQPSSVEGQNLTETMRFSAYSVRNVVLQESFPLDPAQFRDLKARQPVLSIIASALTGGAVAWGVTFGGKYIDPTTSPERWEEVMLVVVSIAACVFHTMAGTFGKSERKELMTEIETFFKSKPREVISISDNRGENNEQ